MTYPDVLSMESSDESHEAEEASLPLQNQRPKLQYAMGSQKTVTENWQYITDEETIEKLPVQSNDQTELQESSPQVQSDRYITIQEDEYIYLKETLAQVVNKNSLLEGKIEALTMESGSSSTFPKMDSGNSSIATDENKEYIDQLKRLAIDIAECKSKHDEKQLELNRLRLETNLEVETENISTNVLNLLEQKLNQTKNKKYADQKDFFIESIVGLSLLFAECKAENDRKDLELRNLKAEWNFQFNQKCRKGSKFNGRRKLSRWLKQKLHSK